MTLHPDTHWGFSHFTYNTKKENFKNAQIGTGFSEHLMKSAFQKYQFFGEISAKLHHIFPVFVGKMFPKYISFYRKLVSKVFESYKNWILFLYIVVSILKSN